MDGYIHSFESLAAVDGAGVRYGVFLAGCPLRCVYCHNPDTWERMAGKAMTAEALVRKVVRYKPYFASTGGVTFSGGEPLLQAAFLCEAAPLLAKEGIGYILDTSGAAPLTEDVRTAIDCADSLLLDLKFPDDAMYRTYTGHGMARVADTLAYLEKTGKPTTVRTVIVPGINDSETMLDRYLSHLRPLHCIQRYELLPFHTMGFFKYEKLGIVNPLADTKALSETVLSRLQTYVNVNI